MVTVLGVILAGALRAWFHWITGKWIDGHPYQRLRAGGSDNGCDGM